MFALRLTMAVGMLYLGRKERHKAMTAIIIFSILSMIGMVVMWELGQRL